MVEKIEWYTFPIMCTGARVSANIVRGFLDAITLGLEEIGFEGKRLSHDALEAKIKCKRCGNSSTYILDFATGGKYMRYGNYEYYSPIDGSWLLYPSNMNFYNLEKVYEIKKKLLIMI